MIHRLFYILLSIAALLSVGASAADRDVVPEVPGSTVQLLELDKLLAIDKSTRERKDALTLALAKESSTRLLGDAAKRGYDQIFIKSAFGQGFEEGFDAGKLVVLRTVLDGVNDRLELANQGLGEIRQLTARHESASQSLTVLNISLQNISQQIGEHKGRVDGIEDRASHMETVLQELKEARVQLQTQGEERVRAMDGALKRIEERFAEQEQRHLQERVRQEARHNETIQALRDEKPAEIYSITIGSWNLFAIKGQNSWEAIGQQLSAVLFLCLGRYGMITLGSYMPFDFLTQGFNDSASIVGIAGISGLLIASNMLASRLHLTLKSIEEKTQKPRTKIKRVARNLFVATMPIVVGAGLVGSACYAGSKFELLPSINLGEVLDAGGILAREGWLMIASKIGEHKEILGACASSALVRASLPAPVV